MIDNSNQNQATNIATPASEAPKFEPFFLKPGASKWESLQTSPNMADEEAKNKVESASEILKSTLLQALQMQHLVVLAGSGCSLYAKMPSMGNLWDAVIGRTPSEEAKKVAKKINFAFEETNPEYRNIEFFLSRVESFLGIAENDTEVLTFLNKAREIILEMCSKSPEEENIIAHERFLHRLSRRRTRDQRLRVYTTNYDLCFEKAAAKVGCVAIDGFSFMTPRRYDPRYFDFDIIRRSRLGDDNGSFLEGVFLLYKLHGSVNWEQTQDSIVEKANPEPSKACLIYPASGKYQQSYNQPYIESISQYLASIREPNTCLLVVGFGFNDDHLSSPLLTAIQSNSNLRVIIVDPFVKEKRENTEGVNVNKSFKKLFELSQNGEDVWFINDSFDGFTSRIPNLKSISPAERLAKDIRDVVI